MASNTLVRQINELRVLNALREHGRTSRTELASLLGLQRSTLSGLAASLLEAGLVHEVEDVATAPRPTGRPAVDLVLKGSSTYFAGLEIGHAVSTAIVLDLHGNEVGRATRPTVTGALPSDTENSLAALLLKAIGGNEHILAHLDGIGVAVPGIVDAGLIVHAPGLGWHDVQFGQILESTFARTVILDNDANAAVSSETQFGVGRTSDNVVYVLLDYGTGVGLALGGTPYRGKGGWAGEAGHIRIPDFGAPGDTWPTVEEFIGIATLRRMCLDHGVENADLSGIVADLHNGVAATERAVEVWENRLTWLLVTIMRLIAPDLFVLGGRASAILDEKRLERLAAALMGVGLDTELSTSTFGVDAVVMGAASLPMSRFFSLPEGSMTRNVPVLGGSRSRTSSRFIARDSAAFRSP